MRRPSGDWQMPFATTSWAGVPSRRWPSNQISPSRGRRSPLIVLSVVDLPAPFEPISVTISPSSIVIEMPLRAWILP